MHRISNDIHKAVFGAELSNRGTEFSLEVDSAYARGQAGNILRAKSTK